jgi:hypothetical protein
LGVERGIGGGTKTDADAYACNGTDSTAVGVDTAAERVGKGTGAGACTDTGVGTDTGAEVVAATSASEITGTGPTSGADAVARVRRGPSA